MTENVVLTHKLLIVKQVVEEATRYANHSHKQSSRLMAIISLDFAVETFLKISEFALKKSGKKNNNSNFNELCENVENLLMSIGKNKLPNRDKIEHVRNLRNSAQHEARYPTKNEILECLIYVRDFLNAASLIIFGFLFDSISLVTLVQNKFVRDLLIQSEFALENKDFPLAIHQANKVISMVVQGLAEDYDDEVNASILSADIVHPGTFSLNSIDGIDTEKIYSNEPILNNPRLEILRRLNDIITNLEIHAMETNLHLIRIQQSFLILSLGLNHAEWLRFRHLVPPFDPQDNTIPEKITRMSQFEAEWVLSYVTSTIIEIENCVGDIERPNFSYSQLS